jgi:osomolarity two-component system sensor histidine kinase SLN1
VVLDARILYNVVTSKVGLGRTGEVVIIGPNEPDNLFAEPVDGRLESQNAEVPLQFVLPPTSNRHPRRAENPYLPFPMGDYPAILKAWSSQNGELNNAGSLMSTHNEENRHIAVGYARIPTDIVDWVVVFGQAYSEVVSPINKLRNTVLICIFSVVGAIIIVCL